MRLLSIVVALGATTTAVDAAQIELLPVDDTQVVYGVGFYADEPDKNYGSASGMAASTSRIAFDWDRIARTLLKFDLSALSSTDSIVGATLHLTQQFYTSNPLAIELVHLQDDTWHEGSVTWNSAPSTSGSSPLAVRNWAPGDPINWTTWSLPVTGEWDWGPDLDDGYVTFMLKVVDDTSTQPNRGVGWTSKEGGVSSAPRLVIDYAPIPLPAAAWLFAPALVVLVGTRRGAGANPADADR